MDLDAMEEGEIATFEAVSAYSARSTQQVTIEKGPLYRYAAVSYTHLGVYQCSSSDRIDVSDHNECHVMLCSVLTKCDYLHRNQLFVIGSGNPGSGTVLHTAGS